MTGYTGRPLAAKLGIKANTAVCLFGAPEEYPGLLEPLPEGVVFSSELTSGTDMIHVFATERERIAETPKRWNSAGKICVAMLWSGRLGQRRHPGFRRTSPRM